MCGASKLADNPTDGEKGATYAVGSIGIHGSTKEVGGFHPKGIDISQCLICIKDGAMVTLENIGAKLRAKFGITQTEVVQFVETPEWHRDDEFVFANGKRVPLIAFADQGVTVYVGIKEATGAADLDPANRVIAATGPAIKSHTGVLETHSDRHRATA